MMPIIPRSPLSNDYGIWSIWVTTSLPISPSCWLRIRFWVAPARQRKNWWSRWWSTTKAPWRKRY